MGASALLIIKNMQKCIFVKKDLKITKLRENFIEKEIENLKENQPGRTLRFYRRRAEDKWLSTKK